MSESMSIYEMPGRITKLESNMMRLKDAGHDVTGRLTVLEEDLVNRIAAIETQLMVDETGPDETEFDRQAEHDEVMAVRLCAVHLCDTSATNGCYLCDSCRDEEMELAGVEVLDVTLD